ncbi:MAG: hypothetical protein HWN69_01630 [Desulfobacterales bacterium]|nr:hypothetical protein [Desulfobacterales bacterium]
MSKIYQQLTDYINWCFTITVALALFLLSRQELTKLYKTDSMAALVSAILLIVTVGRFFLYLHAVRKEIDLFDVSFKTERVNRLHGPVLPIGIALSLTFAVLIAYSTNILIYSIVALLFSVFDIYGPATVNRNLGIQILGKQFGDTKSEQGAKILFNYYFVKPILLRVAILLVMGCFALILATCWHFTHDAAYQYSAYLTWIFSIIVGEIAIYRWRAERDEALNSLENNIENNKGEGQPNKANAADS